MAGAEKIFETKVKAFLKKEGVWHLKYWGGGGFTKSGIPDILACVNGIFVGIELKATNGRPSALQLYNIDEIRRSGGIAMVLYPNDYCKFMRLIKTLKKQQTNNFSELWDKE